MILNIENFVNVGVKTVQIKDVKHFWVKMSDVEKGLGLKKHVRFSKKRNKRHWLR